MLQFTCMRTAVELRKDQNFACEAKFHPSRDKSATAATPILLTFLVTLRSAERIARPGNQSLLLCCG
jgi:hypothetical protein